MGQKENLVMREMRRRVVKLFMTSNRDKSFSPLTESGERQKLTTGLLNCNKFNNSYVSSDHKQMVASVLPDTKTPLVELVSTHTTGPRWWSIFITFFLSVINKSSCLSGKQREWRRKSGNKSYFYYPISSPVFSRLAKQISVTVTVTATKEAKKETFGITINEYGK